MKSLISIYFISHKFVIEILKKNNSWNFFTLNYNKNRIIMSMNVSDQLVEMLKQAGVKRVYAITGDSLNPVNDAIRRDGTLEWIHVRHEESAAYAASMDAEINGIEARDLVTFI